MPTTAQTAPMTNPALAATVARPMTPKINAASSRSNPSIIQIPGGKRSPAALSAINGSKVGSAMPPMARHKLTIPTHAVPLRRPWGGHRPLWPGRPSDDRPKGTIHEEANDECRNDADEDRPRPGDTAVRPAWILSESRDDFQKHKDNRSAGCSPIRPIIKIHGMTNASTAARRRPEIFRPNV